MPGRDRNLPPDILRTPPQMGDQMRLSPQAVEWLNKMSEQAVSKCAFCSDDLAHYESAGLVIEYAGLKFCSVPCLESWIDGQE
jgi:hypothetical protein